MNIYDIMQVNGEAHEIEADFYERKGGDWAFFAGDAEVFRINVVDVLSIGKTSIRPDRFAKRADQLWL